MARRRASGRDVRGILLLDKPAGLTSNRALQRAKRIYQAAKAGHTGSLDPLATGMLPVCFGAATKLSGYLLDAGKIYAVTAELGVETDTGDADGSVTARSEAPPPPAAQVQAVLESFIGESEQVPPMYSALKQQGRRLYDLAREGVVVERAARRVRIDSMQLDRYAWPELVFTVSCSKGTYVRSLVVDIAAALGTLGHVTALRRLAVGPFHAEAMVGFEALERAAAEGSPALDQLLRPVDSVFGERPSVSLPAAAERVLRDGGRVEAPSQVPSGLVRLYAPEGRFIGVGEISPERELGPHRLFVR